VHDVLDSGTTNDRCGTSLDPTIPETTHLRIGSILREDELAGEQKRQLLKRTGISTSRYHAVFLDFFIRRAHPSKKQRINAAGIAAALQPG
jgi:hypothetical protein